MLALSTIEFLINARQKDAKALLKLKRNASSIYLCGYSIELTLKRKICTNFLFLNGFPETKTELNSYGTFPFQVRQIKTHDLNELLFFSGKESFIKTNFINEWKIVEQWNVENRSKRIILKNRTVKNYIRTTQIIINALT